MRRRRLSTNVRKAIKDIEKISLMIKKEKWMKKLKIESSDIKAASRSRRKQERWAEKRKNVRRLKKYFVEDRVTPHPLIVVLKAQYEMLQDNSIVLSCMEQEELY
jgi:hypothetical protein